MENSFPPSLHLEELLRVIAAADKAIMDIYTANSAVVEIKADNSPLTQADMISHHILTNGLLKLFPDIPIVSEEGDMTTARNVVKNEMFWLVDPLDGTKEFLARNGEFTVCIALINNGKPTFGIVSAPGLGATYYGGFAMGSYKRVSGRDDISLQVSRQHKGVVLGSRSHPNEATANYISQHFPAADIKQIGSQLKLPYIAEGLADAYPRLGTTMRLWDLAAGQAILEGAGGTVVRPDGSPVNYNESSLFVGDFIARACEQ